MRYEPNLDKPFSAKGFEEGKQFCTRDGDLVTQLRVEGELMPLSGILVGKYARDIRLVWEINGAHLESRSSHFDLFEVEDEE